MLAVQLPGKGVVGTAAGEGQGQGQARGCAEMVVEPLQGIQQLLRGVLLSRKGPEKNTPRRIALSDLTPLKVRAPLSRCSTLHVLSKMQ